MTEPEASTESTETTISDLRSIDAVLRTLIGKTAIVSTTDSLESIPLGYQIKPSWYRAKLVDVTDTMLVIVTVTTQKNEKIPLKQFLPISTVKRICVGKGHLHLHL